MNWKVKKIEKGGDFLYMGISKRTSKNGKEFDIINLDGPDGSVWLPVFAVQEANWDFKGLKDAVVAKVLVNVTELPNGSYKLILSPFQ